MLCLKYRGSRFAANSLGFQTMKLHRRICMHKRRCQGRRSGFQTTKVRLSPQAKEAALKGSHPVECVTLQVSQALMAVSSQGGGRSRHRTFPTRPAGSPQASKSWAYLLPLGPQLMTWLVVASSTSSYLQAQTS